MYLYMMHVIQGLILGMQDPFLKQNKQNQPKMDL